MDIYLAVLLLVGLLVIALSIEFVAAYCRKQLCMEYSDNSIGAAMVAVPSRWECRLDYIALHL